MKVNVIENSKTSRTLEIEVPEDQVKGELEAAFKRVSAQAEVPGFRKGKVPRDILEKRFRPTAEQEVLDKLIPEAVYQAVQDSKLNIVGQPRVEGLGGSIPPLAFKAVVDIKPDFKLKDLAGIKVEAPSDKVEDSEIDEQIAQLRQRNSVVGEAVDRKAAKGDHVIIDFKGMLKGEAFEGGSAEGYGLTLGQGNFIPGFEDGVEGMKAGDSKTLKLKFPEDYHAEHLKGQKVEFEVKVNEVKAIELPGLDDAFAASVGPFKTVDELKDRIRESLQDQKTQNRKNVMAGQVEAEIAKKHKLDLPETMIATETRIFIDRQAMSLRQQGMEFKDDPETRKQLEEKARPAAEHRVTVRLVLEKIVEQEKFDVSHDELHEEIHKLAPSMGLNAEQAVQWFHEGGREDGLRQQMLETKALEWVLSQAKVKEAK